MGYRKAGFDVIGIDIDPQPKYPFQFLQADVWKIPPGHWIFNVDIIHASPPCQGYTWGTRVGRESYGLEIPRVRELIKHKPYIIENVQNASFDMRKPVLLCGTMFGLRLLKHRLFETNWNLVPPIHNRHQGSVGNGDYVTVAGHGGNNKTGNFSIGAWQEAMGIDWMSTRHDLAEAIPPAYTEYIGRQFLERGQ